ncbi:MAG: two-component system response regulator, partial [Planctomycetes bacterium]|nr:two-component system response regulator [Planctomycetota bacterium]
MEDKPRILFIDDDEDVLEILRSFMEGVDYECIYHSDPKKALG